MDICTESHCRRVEGLIEAMAKAVGYSSEKIQEIKLFARLHDIGKERIAQEILNKPGLLTEQEMSEMRRHSEIGREIAERIAILISSHHEHYDGKGYPCGLVGEEIPLECRMLAIVDAYDAMTSDRVYKKPLSHEQAVLELKRCSGTQFDPQLLDLFLDVMEKFDRQARDHAILLGFKQTKWNEREHA